MYGQADNLCRILPPIFCESEPCIMCRRLRGLSFSGLSATKIFVSLQNILHAVLASNILFALLK